MAYSNLFAVAECCLAPSQLWESPQVCSQGHLLWPHTACSVAQGLLVFSVALTDHLGQISAVTLLFVFTNKTTIYMRLKTVYLVDLKNLCVCVFMFTCVGTSMHEYARVYTHVEA